MISGCYEMSREDAKLQLSQLEVSSVTWRQLRTVVPATLFIKKKGLLLSQLGPLFLPVVKNIDAFVSIYTFECVCSNNVKNKILSSFFLILFQNLPTELAELHTELSGSKEPVIQCVSLTGGEEAVLSDCLNSLQSCLCLLQSAVSSRSTLLQARLDHITDYQVRNVMFTGFTDIQYQITDHFHGDRDILYIQTEMFI